MAELEAYINTEINYILKRPEQGQLKSVLVDDQCDKYVNGTFKELIRHMVTEVSDLTSDQQATQKGLKELINSDSSENRVSVVLHNRNYDKIEGNQYGSGPVYLDDIVRDRIGGDADSVVMSLISNMVVG